MKKKIFNEIIEPESFKKDFKKLRKKFKTLNEDLEDFINIQLKLTHKLKIDNQGVLLISNLGIEYPKISL